MSPNYGVSGPPTDFSSLSVQGVPIINSGGAPFFTGRWVFADYANGSDGNSGGAGDPVKTLSQAYSLMTAGKNDVCVIVSDGTTASTQRISSSFTWAKNACHLIGMASGNNIASRARLAPLTTATSNLNPLMTVSAADCYMGNFSYFQGIGQASTDEQLFLLTGDRNRFENIQFGGMGHANGAARAGSYIIGLDGGDENLFTNCVIGLETIQRSAANASVKMVSASQRNQFYNCKFMMAASATSPLYLDASLANCLNGSSMLFQDCSFMNLTGISGASNPAVAMTANASINGVVIFDRCTGNPTKWCAATTQVIVSGFAIGNGFSSGRTATAADS